jgi:hypothetical protein
MLLILPMALFAEEPAQPAQVTISLTTTVPELLTHGFLTSGDSTDIIPALTVSDAFNEDGATFYYAIQTNISRPFEVYATVTPFELKNASTSAQVAIQKILVGGEEINSSGGEYELIQFSAGMQGMGLTSYILTIIADQTQIESAPSGRYEATVAIDIRSDT